jgi:hypothetical protein
MLKKKVSVESVDGFDPAAAAARAPLRERNERAPRGERRSATRSETVRPAAAPAEPAANVANTSRVRDRGEGHRDDGRSARERQRDEVYANNPDQPAIGRTSEPADAKAALMHGSDAHHHRSGRSKPIPALLMKRRTPEPESA